MCVVYWGCVWGVAVSYFGYEGKVACDGLERLMMDPLRKGEAAEVCGGCPALGVCGSWADRVGGLVGVVAGVWRDGGGFGDSVIGFAEVNRGGRPKVLPERRLCEWCERGFAPVKAVSRFCGKRCAGRAREAAKRAPVPSAVVESFVDPVASWVGCSSGLHQGR